MISWPFRSGSSRKTLYYFWLSLGSLGLFVFAAAEYVRAEKTVDRANEQRFVSYLLADELRQSSDDLTRMVRAYVITGNPRYKQHYYEIIGIRAGTKPRPRDAYNVYWDLVMDDDVRPREFGKAESMSTMLLRAGFTAEELAALTEAKAASDELTRIEYAAMNLVESQSPRDSDRLQAALMLHNIEYRRMKARVMKPIAQFHEMSDQRTLSQVVSAERKADRQRMFVASLGVGLLVSLLGLFLAINSERKQKFEDYELFRALFDNAGVGLAQLSPSGRFEYVNQEFCRILGYSPSHFVDGALTLDQLTLPDDQFTLRSTLDDVLNGEVGDRRLSQRCVHQSGRIVWVSLSVYLIRGANLQPQSLVVALVDITAGKAAEAELENHREHLEQLVEERTLELETGNDRLKRAVLARERAVEALEKSENRFRFIAENSADVIWTMDIASRRFTYVSPSILALRGYTADEVIAQPLEKSLTPDSLRRVEDALTAAVARFNAGNRASSVEVLQLDQPHRDGHVIHTEVVATVHADEYGRLSSVLGVTRNITERLESERAIRELAFLDGLTRLPNRRLLQDRLRQSVLRARRDGSKLAILFVDLDKFKPINDGYGHQVGDWLLCRVAERIQSCLRDSDTAARLGGDEFVVLLPDLAHPDHAAMVAERIREGLAKPFVSSAETTFEISASIGIALYPDHADDAEELLRLGDEAMYQAKNLGRNRVSMLVLSARPYDSGHMPTGSSRSVIHLSWRPSYACGETTIDTEHRELFDLANRLFNAAMVPGQSREALTRRLERIVTAVQKHFQHEEEVLRDLGYPSIEQHARAHRELLAKADQLRRKAEDNELSLGQLLEYLAIDVIARHLLESDREYFPCIRTRSSPPATGT